MTETAKTATRRGIAVPHEGDDGLFSQSWFPICLSEEVPAGTVIGRDFLDGKVVIYRGEDGVVQVKTAYCPHVGADLSVGKVVGNNIQCAFHRWEYGANGRCVKTGIGDPPPPTANLFTFPAEEKYGIVWVFNGEEPLWDLPVFDKADDRIVFKALYTDEYTCDPWIFAANTPDMQHIKVVHGIKFHHEDPHKAVEWDDWGFRYRIYAEHGQGPEIDWTIGIRGTSFYWQQGTVDGQWLGVYSGFSLPRPGRHRPFLAIAVEKSDGTPEGDKRQQDLMNYGTWLLQNTAAEDKPILDTIHYKPRTLTKGDRTLARYLDFLRAYPRAHPAADMIN